MSPTSYRAAPPRGDHVTLPERCPPVNPSRATTPARATSRGAGAHAPGPAMPRQGFWVFDGGAGAADGVLALGLPRGFGLVFRGLLLVAADLGLDLVLRLDRLLLGLVPRLGGCLLGLVPGLGGLLLDGVLGVDRLVLQRLVVVRAHGRDGAQADAERDGQAGSGELVHGWSSSRLVGCKTNTSGGGGVRPSTAPRQSSSHRPRRLVPCGFS